MLNAYVNIRINLNLPLKVRARKNRPLTWGMPNVTVWNERQAHRAILFLPRPLPRDIAFYGARA
jgi:hypothetical protein